VPVRRGAWPHGGPGQSRKVARGTTATARAIADDLSRRRPQSQTPAARSSSNVTGGADAATGSDRPGNASLGCRRLIDRPLRDGRHRSGSALADGGWLDDGLGESARYVTRLERSADGPTTRAQRLSLMGQAGGSARARCLSIRASQNPVVPNRGPKLRRPGGRRDQFVHGLLVGAERFERSTS
jgi:hypothetical protein